jgi:predicted amidohydrolase
MAKRSGEVFKLALVQMLVEGGNRAKNLHHAEDLIAQAASQQADVVLLPEAMDLGWTHPSAKSEAGAIPGGETCQMLIGAAKKHSVYVCSGLIEKAQNGNVYNAAVVVDPGGDIILHHRKLAELDIGHEFYQQGDRLNVCHTGVGTLGLMICADGLARDRVLTRALGYMGADVILSPSSWAVLADHDNAQQPYGLGWREVYIPAAKEFSVWIASVSNVGWITAGPWRDRKCIGCSLVIGPDGREILQGPYGPDAETILYVDVDPVKRPTRGLGWNSH